MKKLIIVLALFALACNNEEKSVEKEVYKAEVPVIDSLHVEDSLYVADSVDVLEPIK